MRAAPPARAARAGSAGAEIMSDAISSGRALAVPAMARSHPAAAYAGILHPLGAHRRSRSHPLSQWRACHRSACARTCRVSHGPGACVRAPGARPPRRGPRGRAHRSEFDGGTCPFVGVCTPRACSSLLLACRGHPAAARVCPFIRWRVRDTWHIKSKARREEGRPNPGSRRPTAPNLLSLSLSPQCGGRRTRQE